MTATAPQIDQYSGPRLAAYLRATDPPTQAEIARVAGVSRQYVWKVLNGRSRPSHKIVQAVRELGLPVEILGG